MSQLLLPGVVRLRGGDGTVLAAIDGSTLGRRARRRHLPPSVAELTAILCTTPADVRSRVERLIARGRVRERAGILEAIHDPRPWPAPAAAKG